MYVIEMGRSASMDVYPSWGSKKKVVSTRREKIYTTHNIPFEFNQDEGHRESKNLLDHIPPSQSKPS